MIMTKKVKKRYGTISKLFQAKGVSKKKTEKRTRKKTKPYLKFYGNVRNVMECCMFSTANRLSRRLHRFSLIEITAEKLQMPVRIEVTNLKPITELRK
jgi:hypothetical protein